jgi:hypothetical protein
VKKWERVSSPQSTVSVALAGDVLAVGLDNGDVDLYSYSTTALTRTIVVNGGRISAVAFTFDHSGGAAVIVTEPTYSRLTMWTVATGAFVRYIGAGLVSGNSGLVVAPNGELYVLGSVIVFDPTFTIVLRSWPAPNPAALVFVGGGSTLLVLPASGSGVTAYTESNPEPPSASATPTPSMSASPIPQMCQAITIAAGALHTCALMTTGGVRCWGWNHYGQVSAASM